MTIPQHLIDKVVRAWIINEGRDPDDPCEEWKYTGYADDARVALEAVAADIWDEGFEVGEGNGYAIGRDIDTDEDTTNPYKRIEHA